MICNKLIDPNCSGTQTANPKAYFNGVVQAVLSIFMLVGIIYFIWHFVMAGFHLIASHGDPKKYEEARNEITYALMGILVVLSIFAILKLVGHVFGIPGLSNLGSPTLSWPTL